MVNIDERNDNPQSKFACAEHCAREYTTVNYNSMHLNRPLLFSCITHQMRYDKYMRTTLDIEDEILLTVKQIAQQRKTTAGSVVSGLLRESLAPKSFAIEYRDGVPVLPRRPNGPTVTTELVNRLLNEDE